MRTELTDEELETYSRQIVLADIGYEGQLKLRNARVCLVGAGGLGSPVALKLTGMGIGFLRVVDRDIVSRSDLHRQYLYDADSIGIPKVEVLFQKLSRLNPDVGLDPVPESLNAVNAEELLAGMDVVIDGLDRPEPRYIVNRTCNRLKIPYIFGAAIEAFGNVSTILPGRTFCLECFMPGLHDEDLPVCGVVGVHPSILGIISAVQVSEAVGVITGRGPKLSNKLLYVDLREFEFNILDIPAMDSCKVCGSQPNGAPQSIRDSFFEETCARDGRRNFVVSPLKRVAIDLGQLAAVIERQALKIKRIGDYGITFESPDGMTVCILKSAIMIVQTPPLLENTFKTQVLAIYRSVLIDGLGLPEDILPDG